MRARLAELEDARATRVREAAEVADAMETAAQRAKQLKEEARRHRENAAVSAGEGAQLLFC